ncbi:MAG: hypothetical protein ABI778_01710, partial [Ignavibacteriota bacterium]
MVHRIFIAFVLLTSFIFVSSVEPCEVQGQICHQKCKPGTAKHRAKTYKYSRKKTKKTNTGDSVAHLENRIERNYPPPGSGGEDRNIGWLKKRAFPNEFIDPDAYLNALAEARKVPVWGSHVRNGIQASMQWQSIGPKGIGGRVTSIATHPTDSNIFYVGAAAGGLWKTSDHGNSWQALTDTFASLPIGTVMLDPHDPNTIYLGMGECNSSADSYPGNGLWRSTNAGASWESLGLAKTQYIAKIIIDSQDKNIIYVCSPGPNSTTDTNGGIWKSVDYGKTWIHSLSSKVTVKKITTVVPTIDLVVNPQDHNDLVTALWDKYSSNDTATGLWRSRDGGANWKRIDTIASGYPNGAQIKRLARTSLLWAVNNKGAATLYSVVTKIDTNAVTHSATDENLFGIFRTTDPEGTWSKVLDSTYRIPYLGNNVDSADLFYRQGGYNNFIVANPKHPDEIYVGGIDVICSYDGGNSWTNITQAYPHYFSNDRSQHSDQHALAFTAATSGTDLLNGQDGGVFNTTNAGVAWTQLKGLPITMFYHLETWDAGMASLGANFPPDSIKLMGGTQDNGTVAHGFSTNPDWDWINRGDGGQSQSDPNNRNHLVTSLQLGKIFFRTTLDSLRPNLYTDNGTNDPNAKKWFDLSTIARRRGITDSSEPCSFIPPVLLDKVRGDEVFTGRTKIYRSKLSFTEPDTATTVLPWSPQLVGVSNNPKLWFYGGDIEAIAIGPRDNNGRPMIWCSGVSATDSPTGLTNGTTRVWRTTVDPLLPQDSAPKWITAANGLPFAIPSALVCDRSDSMTAFAGLMGYSATRHLYKTTNGGKNWSFISGKKSPTVLPNAPVNSFLIDTLAESGDPNAKNRCLIVATDVGVFVTTDGGDNWEQLGTGLPNIVVENVTMYRNWLIAGTHGRSAWALDISDLKALPLGVVSEGNGAAGDFRIRSIFPSPLRRSGVLNFELNQKISNHVGIEIFAA